MLSDTPLPPPLPSLKSLPPWGQQLCYAVRRFVHQQTTPCLLPGATSVLPLAPPELQPGLRGKTLLLAVSGGADSLALTLIVALLRPSLGHAVHVAHVDHGLRAESVAEGRWVAKLCAAWDLPCTLLTADVRGHAARQRVGLEEAGRLLRYALLEETRVAHGAQWICTGHHSGDLEEDMVMRLLRGTGWPALGGMAAVDGQRCLLRPLLLTRAADLRTLLQHCGVVWAEDASNADVRFTRNRIRHQLIPLLHAENPAFDEAAAHLWHRAQDDAEYWEKELNARCASHNAVFEARKVLLPAALLRASQRAVRMRLYMRAVRHLALHRHADEQGQGDVLCVPLVRGGQARACTLQLLDEAWSQGRGGTVFQLPGGLSAHVRQGAVTFKRF